MTATEIMKMMEDAGSNNGVIFENMIRANLIFRQHHKIVASISGGSDSDIVLEICEKVKGDRDITYVWFDTGIEYQATKDHLKYLEARYGITIQRIKAIKSIPTCCREYGIPFVSKYVSEHLERLQRNHFDFTDRPYEELLEKYPRIQSSVAWWSNIYKVQDGYSTSMYNINRNKYLKEFLIANPPDFNISPKCCTFAKKKVAHKFRLDSGADLDVIGVRRAEGGYGQ